MALNLDLAHKSLLPSPPPLAMPACPPAHFHCVSQLGGAYVLRPELYLGFAPCCTGAPPHAWAVGRLLGAPIAPALEADGMAWWWQWVPRCSMAWPCARGHSPPWVGCCWWCSWWAGHWRAGHCHRGAAASHPPSRATWRRTDQRESRWAASASCWHTWGRPCLALPCQGSGLQRDEPPFQLWEDHRGCFPGTSDQFLCRERAWPFTNEVMASCWTPPPT